MASAVAASCQLLGALPAVPLPPSPPRRPICHLNNLDSEEDNVIVFLDEVRLAMSAGWALACVQGTSGS